MREKPARCKCPEEELHHLSSSSEEKLVKTSGSMDRRSRELLNATREIYAQFVRIFYVMSKTGYDGWGNEDETLSYLNESIDVNEKVIEKLHSIKKYMKEVGHSKGNDRERHFNETASNIDSAVVNLVKSSSALREIRKELRKFKDKAKNDGSELSFRKERNQR